MAARRCRGWGASACTARKPSRAMEREERARFVAVDPSTYCSPRSETSSNVSPLRLFESKARATPRTGRCDWEGLSPPARYAAEDAVRDASRSPLGGRRNLRERSFLTVYMGCRG